MMYRSDIVAAGGPLGRGREGGRATGSRGAAHSNHNTRSENRSDDIFVAGKAFPEGEGRARGERRKS